MRGLIGITITSYFLDPLFDRHDPLGFTAEGVLLCARSASDCIQKKYNGEDQDANEPRKGAGG